MIIKKKNVGHDNLKEITLDRLDETFEQVLKSLPNDKIFTHIFLLEVEQR